MSDEHPHIALARRYLAALEAGAAGAELGAFLHPHIVQRELPNRLTPAGRVRDRSDMLADAERARQVLAGQTYAVVSALVDGDRVALEIDWTGTLALPIGTLGPGDTMRAWVAVFLDIRDGMIAGQRNYDCFPPL